jgi:uncharacterized protein YbjT (DUF2867 family)
MIVVCGATGQQGGAVIDALVALGRGRLRGLTRDVNGSKAEALRMRGVDMVKADLANADSLAAAFDGARAVFAVTQPWTADYRKASPWAEVEQGKAIIAAAERMKVEHVVFSTVILDREHRKTGVPHVDSKIEIESALAKSKLPWTVLGPGTFMDNIGTKFFPVGHKSIRGFVSKETALPYIAVRDIGRAAAKVIADPSSYLGRRLNLIAGIWDGDALCAALRNVYGRPYRWNAPPRLLMRIFAPEFYKMRLGFEKFGRPPFPATYLESVESTHKLLPDVWSIEDYVREKRPGPGTPR